MGPFSPLGEVREQGRVLLSFIDRFYTRSLVCPYSAFVLASQRQTRGTQVSDCIPACTGAHRACACEVSSLHFSVLFQPRYREENSNRNTEWRIWQVGFALRDFIENNSQSLGTWTRALRSHEIIVSYAANYTNTATDLIIINKPPCTPQLILPTLRQLIKTIPFCRAEGTGY